MSIPDFAPVPTAEPYESGFAESSAAATSPSRPRASVTGIVAFALGILFFCGLFIFRLLDPIITDTVSNSTSIATALGIFGVLTILPVAVVVVLGHLAVASTKSGGKRGRGIAIAGMVLGYALAAIYFNTVITAVVASAFPHQGPFIQNMFYWV